LNNTSACVTARIS